MSENTENIKKPIYKKWWFWLIIAFIVILALGSSGENTTEQPNISTNITPSTNVDNTTNIDTSNKVYAVGEEAFLNNTSITVTKVEKSNGSEYDKPQSGKEFVILYITIKNIGNSNLSYNPYNFQVQNSQGQLNEPTFTIIDNDTSLQTGELIPNGSISGTIVFEESINDSNLTLIYQDNFWSSKSLKIKL